MGCVYCVINKINGKKYIGKTIQPLKRRRQTHERDAKNKKYPNLVFHNALRKYGFGNFEWDILFESGNEGILLKEEIDEIQYQNTKIPNGYNMTDGGDGLVGATAETKKKMSESAKARQPRIITEEEKVRISKSLMGHFVSEETRKRIGIGRKGKKHTEEAKRKISEAGKGRNKGKTFEEMYGKEKSEEMKRNLSDIFKGKKLKNPRKKPKPLSAEHRANISKALKSRRKLCGICGNYGHNRLTCVEMGT